MSQHLDSTSAQPSEPTAASNALDVTAIERPGDLLFAHQNPSDDQAISEASAASPSQEMPMPQALNTQAQAGFGSLLPAFVRRPIEALRHPAPHRSFQLASWLFLRGMGLTYLFAFASIWSQYEGLFGSQGLLPVGEYLDLIESRLPDSRFQIAPTLAWLNPSDGFLNLMCGLGVVAAVMAILGVAQLPALGLMWVLYLSLSVAGQDFFRFQWDSLLLEAGLLALLLAPLNLAPQGPRKLGASTRIARLLLVFLLFKLMFLSGLVKLLSGDTTWRELTALHIHYQTQPLPNGLSWWAHHLPGWMHKAGVAATLAIELVFPFFVFGPWLLRRLAFFAFVGLMTLIGLTGNYGFFNLLTVVLCLLIADDALLTRLLPRRVLLALGAGGDVALSRGLSGELKSESDLEPALGAVSESLAGSTSESVSGSAVSGSVSESLPESAPSSASESLAGSASGSASGSVSGAVPAPASGSAPELIPESAPRSASESLAGSASGSVSGSAVSGSASESAPALSSGPDSDATKESGSLSTASAKSSKRGRFQQSPPLGQPRTLPWWIVAPLALLLFQQSAMKLSDRAKLELPWPKFTRSLEKTLQPLRSINSYGLFASMTTRRPEIVLEGSNDGQEWVAYELHWKPGDPKQRPRFAGPHMPRLDWQMWFAALGSAQRNPWVLRYMDQLLTGSPTALDFIRHNPFPDAPPRFIRAMVYEYRYSEDLKDGYWDREALGLYTRPRDLGGRRVGVP